jgi:hypothetical protein
MTKIGIVARAGTASLAPYTDPEWELWGLPWVSYPRIDAVFEVHEQPVWDDRGIDLAEDGACNPEATVYAVTSRMYRFKNSECVEFDTPGLAKQFPDAPFDNSLCYQMAYAVTKAPKTVGLWGVHMVSKREYLWERAGVQYWVGYMRGLGIEVIIPPGSPLFLNAWTAGRYGVNWRMRDLKWL